jgi:hypothetical protein
MSVAIAAMVNILALGNVCLHFLAVTVVSVFKGDLSQRSYIWTRVCKFIWPFIMVICGIRAILMIVELQRGQVLFHNAPPHDISLKLIPLHRKHNIAWECENGGQLWPASVTAGYDNGASFPSSFCTSGFTSVYTAFIISLLVDLGFQVRARHCISVYGDVRGADDSGRLF